MTTIAVAGKGGVGKTTVSGLVIEALRRRSADPILAVDADPNATLGEMLGLTVETTVGQLQAETLASIRELRSGVPLGRRIETELHRAIVEGIGVDLLSMGHGEGPGCYCAVNSILRRCIEALAANYAYVVLDNEAGLEHLSRRLAQGGDVLLVVSDANPVALRAATRISGLADKLGLGFGRRGLVLNNLRGRLSPRSEEEILRTGLPVLGRLDHDAWIEEANLEGLPLGDLPDTHPALLAVGRILQDLIGGESE